MFSRASLIAALVAALPGAPIVAALLTVLAVAPTTWSTFREVTGEIHPLVPAILTFFATWALLGVGWVLLGSTGASRVNPDSFNNLKARLLEAKARYPTLLERSVGDQQASMACGTAKDHIDDVTEAVESAGPQWILGSGYIAAWDQMHRAEEALIRAETPEAVLGAARYDRLRSVNSGVSGGRHLSEELDEVMEELSRRRNDGAAVDVWRLARAREVVSQFRRAINEFRDARWAELVRSRNHLLETTTITGLIMYALLWFALVTGVQRDTLVAATAYYLIGAAVGLFNHLHINAGPDLAPVDDYGLASARLLVTLLLSGLAAVGGVIVIAILTLTQTGSIGTEQNPIDLVGFLNLAKHPLNIVVAATFGLTPGVLVSRLKHQAEQYKSDLQRSQPEDSAATPAAAAPVAAGG